MDVAEHSAGEGGGGGGGGDGVSDRHDQQRRSDIAMVRDEYRARAHEVGSRNQSVYDLGFRV
jgi:hypothetical protein